MYPSKIKKKPTQTLDKVLNYEQNTRYLQMRKNKFWHLAEQKKRQEIVLDKKDSQTKKDSCEYVAMKGLPSLASFCIKNYGAYSFHKSQIHIRDRTEYPVREVPINEDNNVSIGSIGPEDFLKVENCNCPTTLMCITDYEQSKMRYTVDQKIGVPMYEEEEADETDHATDEQQKKKLKSSYTPRRIVAPPEYPFRYYRLRKNQTCPHCGNVGKNCHNIRFGPYLAAVLARFHREHYKYYNKFDAARLFVESYRVLAEFEDDHLQNNTIKAVSYGMKLPECTAFDSLVFALNAVKWTIMWGLNNGMIPVDKVDSSEDEEPKKVAESELETKVKEEKV